MTDDQWVSALRACATVLGAGTSMAATSASWCAWTTFRSLAETLHYWSAGLPSEADLGVIGTKDTGPWSQPFLYRDLAHFIIPKTFYWEAVSDAGFTSGIREQDLAALSVELQKADIPHRRTERVLEIKLY